MKDRELHYLIEQFGLGAILRSAANFAERKRDEQRLDVNDGGKSRAERAGWEQDMHTLRDAANKLRH